MQAADKVSDVPVALVVLVPLVQVVAKTVEIPQLLLVAQVPHVQVVEKTVEIPQLPFDEKIVVIPGIQKVQGPQTSESLSGEITVAVKIDHETVMRGVAQNIQIDPFMDDFSSVDSKELNHQYCEVPSHVGKQSGSTHQQHTPGQAEIEEEREEGEKDEVRRKEEGKSQGERVQREQERVEGRGRER